MIAPNKIPNFLIEFFWLSPFSWTIRTIAQSEFSSSHYSDLPSPDKSNQTYSHFVLSSIGMETNTDYKWAGIGYLAGWFLVWSTISAFAIAYRRFELTRGSSRLAYEEDEQLQLSLQQEYQSLGNTVKKEHLSVIQISSQQSRSPESENNSSAFASSWMKSGNGNSVLDLKPRTLTFRNLSYTITLPDKTERMLLRGINGYSKPGTLTALMGSSGAGLCMLLLIFFYR